MRKYFILLFMAMSVFSACSLTAIARSEYGPDGELSDGAHPETSAPPFAYGRSLLSGHQLAAYDEILKNAQNWKENAAGYGDIFHRIYYKLASQGINISSSAEFGRIASYVGNDHPKFYLVNFSSAPREISYKDGYLDGFYTYGVPDYIGLSEYNSGGTLLENQVKKFLAGLTPAMNEAQKARYLHDRLLEHVGYSMNPAYRVADAYGALVSGKALCEGYARGYLYLLQRAGLKAFYTVGYMLTSSVDNSWGLHAWVGVQVDGLWYYIDITSDDGVSNIGYHHNYFLIGQSDFNKGYKYDDGLGNRASFPLPAISPSNYPQDKSIY